MRAVLLAFIVAVIATTQLLGEELSSISLIALVGLGLVGCWVLPHGWRWPLAALFGIAWSAISAHSILERQLSADADRVELYLQVLITGVPAQSSGDTLFYARVQQLVEGQIDSALPKFIRLRWYARGKDDQSVFRGSTAKHGLGRVKAGEVWRLRLRLRPPDGFLNPAGLDYQRWLFLRQIGATGYVINSHDNQLIETRTTIHSWREDIALSMARHLPESPQLGLVQGLGVAVREGISDDQWQLLADTGTAHLLAISGMHIGMVAATVGWLFASIWRCVPPLVRRVPSLIAGTLAGVGAAAGYAALAGFTLPTQRALIMIIGFALALLARRPLHPWNSFVIAAAAVLVINPWAPLGAGFWLSFGAVAVIILATQGRKMGRGVWPWLRLQAVIGIALLPSTALWFGNLPWLSPLANWIAVPWVSFAVVPLVLGGIVFLPLSDQLAGWSWQLAAMSLAGLMNLLGTLDVPLGSYVPVFSLVPVILLASWGVLYMLAPQGLPGRWLALPLLLVLALGPVQGNKLNEQIVVFDTGAGMAALIQGKGEAVIYGAGPGGSLNAVDVALGPYLEELGLQPIAWVVPRREDPWSGAIRHGKRRWSNLLWVDTPYDCANWRHSWGGLELFTQIDDRGRCELIAQGRNGMLTLKPNLMSERQPESDKRPARTENRMANHRGHNYVVGMLDCQSQQVGFESCQLVLARSEENGTGWKRLAATPDEGAITVYPSYRGWHHVTELDRRGRVFHRQSGGNIQR